MLRIVLVILALIAALLLVRWFLRAKPSEVSRWIKRSGFIALLGVLLFLALTGRLHWLFAIITGSIPVGMRLWRAWQAMRVLRRKPEQQAHTPPPASSAMTREHAYHILGLQPGASTEEIIKAHRKLMQKLHPDRGGTDELASQLNAAKEFLLKDR